MEGHTREFAESILLESMRVSKILFKDIPSDNLDRIVGQHLRVLEKIRAGDGERALRETRGVTRTVFLTAFLNGIFVNPTALSWASGW